MLFSHNTSGRRMPLILTHGMYGFLPYRRARTMAEYMGPEQPIYGLEAPGFDGVSKPFASIQDAASSYLQEIRRAGAKGPFVIAGLCAGCLVAFQIAQQLTMEAQFAGGTGAPPLLLMIDPPGIPGEGVAPAKFTPAVVDLLREQVRTWFLSARDRTEELPFDIGDPASFARGIEAALALEMSMNRYFASPYHGRVEILVIENRAEILRRKNWPWQKVLAGPWNMTTIACRHSDLFTSQAPEVFAWLKKYIDAVQGDAAPRPA